MARVVIFDSGVGGLSIHQALVQKRPDLEYQFVSDNAAFPYGTKADSELIARVDEVVAAISQQLKPDLIVIACNTASTVALAHLRAAFEDPFVGVVPAIKPAAKLTQSGKIAVLGTPATARRTYTKQLVADFAPNCEVKLIGSSVLVELAESKLRGEVIPLALIEQELSSILTFDGCDTLVLACTHFPLLFNEIKHFFDAESDFKSLKIIDSGEAIARRVDALLPAQSSARENSHSQSGSWFTRPLNTDNPLAAVLHDRKLPIAGDLQL